MSAALHALVVVTLAWLDRTEAGAATLAVYDNARKFGTCEVAETFAHEADSRCGVSRNICDGIIRARFRNGLDHEELLQPGKVYAYDIDCWATAWTFKAGHRIRIQVSSSNFPAFDRNTNTGLHLTESCEVRKAKQTICHKPGAASCIILPVIPKK